MAEPKEQQRILVWCNQSDGIELVVQYAVHLARVLEKEVCFLGTFTKQRQQQSVQLRVDGVAAAVAPLFPQIPFSKLVLKGALKNVVHDLGNVYGAILLCLYGKMPRAHLNAFYESGFPFLYVKSEMPVKRGLQQLVVPLDYRSGTKEAVLWSSFLGRFTQAAIHLVKPADRQPENRERVDKVLAFAQRLYKSVNFTNFRIVNGQKSSWGIHREAISSFPEADLFIVTGSLNVTLIDRLTGPFERNLVKASGTAAVLLVNPQRELLLVCCRDAVK